MAPRMLPQIAPVESLSPEWLTASSSPSRMSSAASAAHTAIASASSPVQPPPSWSSIDSGVGPAVPVDRRVQRRDLLLVAVPGQQFRPGGGDRVGQLGVLQQQVDQVRERAGGQVAARVAVGEQRAADGEGEPVLAEQRERRGPHDRAAALGVVEPVGERAPLAAAGERAERAGDRVAGRAQGEQARGW